MLQTMVQRYINTSNSSHKSRALPPQLHLEDNVANTVHLEDNVANTDNEKAKLFNQYFFTKSNFQLPNLDGLNPSANSLETIHLTEPDLFRATANLNLHKATGIDLIAPNPVLAPFHYLCSTCSSPV